MSSFFYETKSSNFRRLKNLIGNNVPFKPKKPIKPKGRVKRKVMLDYYRKLADYHEYNLDKYEKIAVESSLALTVNASSHIMESLTMSLVMYVEKDPKFLKTAYVLLRSMFADLKLLNRGLNNFREATQVKEVDDLMKYAGKVGEHLSNYKQVLENLTQDANSSDRESLKPPEEPIFYLNYITWGATSIAVRRRIADNVEGIGLLNYDDWKRRFDWLRKRQEKIDSYLL